MTGEVLNLFFYPQGDFICDNNDEENESKILKNKPCVDGKYEVIEFVPKKKKKKKFTVCLCWAVRFNSLQSLIINILTQTIKHSFF